MRKKIYNCVTCVYSITAVYDKYAQILEFETARDFL